jgi:hypothetical protein
MPGTSAYAFGTLMKQIGGKNFLAAYQQLKGAGNVSEIEGTKAEAAQARLATAQSKEDFDKALNEFERTIRTDMETVQRKVNAPVSAWRLGADNSTYAPDKGQRGVRKGTLQEYIGGNPRDDQSYRPVQ